MFSIYYHDYDVTNVVALISAWHLRSLCLNKIYYKDSKFLTSLAQEPTSR